MKKKLLGYRCLVSNGQYIPARCVDGQGLGEVPAMFDSLGKWAAFVRQRKMECKVQGVACVFVIHKYRFVPVYA